MEKKVLTSLAVLFSLVQTSSANGVPEWVQYGPDGYGFGTYTPAGGQWTCGTKAETFQWGWDAALPVVGNYDGDIFDDYAVYAPADGNWLIRFADTNSPVGVACTNYYWGWYAALPVPGDYDGDGRTDLAVYTPDGETAGNWYLRYSKGGSYSNYAIVNWGYPGAIPVPADWDGDGRTDPAVYDNGTWYITRSTDGSYYPPVFFGYPGCLPFPADLDGDGTIDFVVVDPATYTWYAYLSKTDLKSLFVTFQFGYAGTVPYADLGEVGVYDPNSGLVYYVWGFSDEDLKWNVDAQAKKSTLYFPQNVILKQLGLQK